MLAQWQGRDHSCLCQIIDPNAKNVVGGCEIERNQVGDNGRVIVCDLARERKVLRQQAYFWCFPSCDTGHGLEATSLASLDSDDQHITSPTSGSYLGTYLLERTSAATHESTICTRTSFNCA